MDPKLNHGFILCFIHIDHNAGTEIYYVKMVKVESQEQLILNIKFLLEIHLILISEDDDCFGNM